MWRHQVREPSARERDIEPYRSARGVAYQHGVGALMADREEPKRKKPDGLPDIASDASNPNASE
jgi:hypothetical protein